MNAEIARARLAGVPKDVRDEMLRQRADLPPGAIAVVARFFEELERRGEHVSAPSRETFAATCGSESTLALLLRMLGKYAPLVCLAEGRELRRDYYSKRPAGPAKPEKRRAGLGVTPTEARHWPEDWQALLPGLRAAPIKDSSINRHVASINRCAALAPRLTCPPRLGWLFAWELAATLQEPDDSEDRPGVGARTAASYIGALLSLGLHGGLDADRLDGLRSVRSHLQRQGRRLPKRKQTRIEALYEAGGYAKVMRVVVSTLEAADKLPDWSAEAAKARATAAILAVCTNDPARTGDVAMWTLGGPLVRRPTGQWQLRWRQGKTGHWKEAGTLWPEMGAVVDEHILGGRPRRHVQQRYEALKGNNWLSLAPEPYAGRWPSEMVKLALGVPLHDLRTLAADYLRYHDPVAAPRIVAVLLGHRSQEAGGAYSALCAETAAQRDWQALRAVHAGR
ncbi:hypothetical protein [Marinovum sp.]|uniref:hypothetical protein n=1 Tax=Marinovum sp. TaxID=2024839 RepID=UPI003A959F14